MSLACVLVVDQERRPEVGWDRYRYAPHNDVSVNDGPHNRRWPHNIIILAIVLQLPIVFSTVTSVQVCSVGAIGYTI